MIRNPFLTSDYTVPINTTVYDGTDFTSVIVGLEGIWSAAITVFVQGGHASCSLEITFNFVSYDSKRQMWDTTAYFTTSLYLSGTTALQKTVVFDPSVELVKLYSVHNPETTTGYTATVNASIVRHIL